MTTGVRVLLVCGELLLLWLLSGDSISLDGLSMGRSSADDSWLPKSSDPELWCSRREGLKCACAAMASRNEMGGELGDVLLLGDSFLGWIVGVGRLLSCI
jgi:hypothetical protein